MRKCRSEKICIICEGYEETEYIKSLVNKAVFSDKYSFVLINSKSINSIVARYQEKYTSDSYSIVLIFCDTDKKPSTQYKIIKEKINAFHGNDVANDIVIFGNPCTMQIILSHFAEIKLTSQSKKVNSKYVEKYIGIENYNATEEQRKELFSKIKRSNYEIMKKNISRLSTNDDEVSSTNILKFINYFENDDDSWISDITEKL